MASARAIRAGAAYVELLVNDSKLVRGLANASRKLKAFGAAVTGWGQRIAAIGAAVTAPLIGSAKAFSQMGDQIAKMSKRTGISVESLSELAYAAQLSGASVETLETGVRKMQRSIADAAEGTKTAVDALATLGLTVNDLRGLSPEQQFKLIAERLSQIRNPTLKAALAMELLGRSGTQLLPLMENGAAGIDALQKQARDLGLTMSTEDAKSAEALNDAFDALWKVLKHGVFIIGSALAPTVQKVVERVTQVVVSITGWIKENKNLVVTVFKVAAAVLAGGLAVLGLGYAISATGVIFGAFATIITGVGAAVGVAGSVLASLLTPIGLVSTAVVALGAYLIYASGIGGKAIAWLGERFSDLSDFASEAFSGIADALAAGDIALAAQILWLSLKVAWVKGVGALESAWLTFRNFFIRIAYDAFYGAQAAWEIVQHGLEVAWIETTAFLSKTWTSFTSGFQEAWNSAVNWTSKRLLELQGLFDSSLDVDAAKQMADQELAGANAQIEQQKQAALNAREQQRQAERQQAAQTHEGELGRIGQESIDKQKALDDEHAARVKVATEELEKARKEMQDAVGQARQKRQFKDSQAPGKTAPPPDIADLLSGLGPTLQQTQKTIGVAGTFNAFEARGLGAGGVADRIAKASEQTATNTKKMLEELEDMDGAEFE
jgi:hypothetical protein